MKISVLLRIVGFQSTLSSTNVARWIAQERTGHRASGRIERVEK